MKFYRIQIGCKAYLTNMNAQDASIPVSIDHRDSIALSDFDVAGGADFQIHLNIDGGSSYNSPVKGGDNTPTFNFGARQEVPLDQEVIEIRLAMTERDLASTINMPDISLDRIQGI